MANHDYLRTTRDNGTMQLRMDVLALMIRGGGYGAAFFVGLFVVGYIIVAVSNALPADSKEADDPTPVSFLMIEDPENRST
ncbi:MAG: RC-LH1 core complex protein PufX [Sedimentitalea sp.]